MLIDTHVHLNADKFNDNLHEVIKRAKDNDVQIMIVVGFDKKTNKKAIKIAESHPFIYATVGYHPTDAKNIKDADFEYLEELLKHEKVVGVGECGLDFYWDKEHKEAQIDVFKKHIELSKKVHKFSDGRSSERLFSFMDNVI